MIYALLLLDFPDHSGWGGPHPGPDHFPGFFFGPAIFWVLLLGFIFLRMTSRHAARHAASRPAPGPTDPPTDQTPWPNLDPAPQPSDDDYVPKGKIEYF